MATLREWLIDTLADPVRLSMARMVAVSGIVGAGVLVLIVYFSSGSSSPVIATQWQTGAYQPQAQGSRNIILTKSECDENVRIVRLYSNIPTTVNPHGCYLRVEAVNR